VTEVSVRIDMPAGTGTPAISVLAFRAAVKGIDPSQVLGVVDPLVTSRPEGGCEVRDVAAAARWLRVQGGGIELDELARLSLIIDDNAQPLQPAPRVYPQLASTVGGVVTEAGPVDLVALPRAITFLLPPSESDGPVKMNVVGMPQLLDAAGAPLASPPRFDGNGELTLTVSGPAHSLEIRPFGASQAVACPVGADGKVVVRRELIERVVPANGHRSVSFEAVWRDTRMVPLPGGVAGQTARLSLETRSSTVLDLHAAVTAEPPRAPASTVP
jgi:hypothetical protein